MFKKLLLLALASSLVIGNISAKDLKINNSYDSRYIETDDKVKLHVVDWGGDGTALVFLAGLSLNAHTFDHLAKNFIHSYRVIGITRVGHGKSESRKEDFSMARLSKDIINVLDSMKIDNAIFAGHSFAGGELTHLGINFPKRVRGLIYIDALQSLEYMDSHIAACPDIGYANIDMSEYKEHFYATQRVKNNDGSYAPFADLNVLGRLIDTEKNAGRDYTGIIAPAIAINHIPEQTEDFFLGIGKPTQKCFEEINKLTYLGIANFVKNKPNADVAAIQNSQHMIHMATPEKLVKIINDWLNRTFFNPKS